MSKTFTEKARRPGRKPSEAEIAAFEAGKSAAPASATDKGPAWNVPGVDYAVGPSKARRTKLSVLLAEDLHAEFQIACIREKTTMSDKVASLIGQFLNQGSKDK